MGTSWACSVSFLPPCTRLEFLEITIPKTGSEGKGENPGPRARGNPLFGDFKAKNSRKADSLARGREATEGAQGAPRARESTFWTL